MSKNNNVKRYGQYKVNDLFDIHPTKSCKVSGEKGKTPFLSNTALNNGIAKYVKEEPTEKGGMITFSDTTESEKTVFYQERDYIGFSHIQGMYARNKEVWNKNKYLYFIGAFITGIGKGFNYANKFNRDKAKNVIVLMPIKDEVKEKVKYDIEDIDFNYMEERIKELEEERIKELEEYLEVSGLENYELTAEDEEVLGRKVEFKEFYIGKTKEHEGIFKQLRGKESKPNQVPDGNINMVNETSSNNGITKKASSKNVFKAPAITVSVNFAKTVYLQEEDFCASVNILILKNEEIEKHKNSMLYICALLSKNNEKYNYTNKISKDRLNDTIINLPVNKQGQIDYDYMDKYIEVMKKKTIKNIVEYKDKIINLTKEVVK